MQILPISKETYIKILLYKYCYSLIFVYVLPPFPPGSQGFGTSTLRSTILRQSVLCTYGQRAQFLPKRTRMRPFFHYCSSPLCLSDTHTKIACMCALVLSIHWAQLTKI